MKHLFNRPQVAKFGNGAKKVLINLALIMLMTSAKTVFGQVFINSYSADPIKASSLQVQKTVQDNSPDSDFYVLSTGTDTSAFNNAVDITVVTRYTRTGTLLWTKRYGIGVVNTTSSLLGYAIAVDNGGNNTGHIAVGGYLTMDGGGIDNDFVMELDTTGTVRWFQYWNPNNPTNTSKGVTDLLYNHEPGTNSGSITVVSIDENSTSSVLNLYVTILNSTGILNAEQLTDATGDYYHDPILAFPHETYLKPRIVESVSDSEYCVVGNRNVSGSNEIGLWKMKWNFGRPTVFPVLDPLILYHLTGLPPHQSNVTEQTFATGMTEDEGTYSTGSPTIYISGYYDSSTAPPLPFILEVTAIGVPASGYAPAGINPFTLSNTTDLYPTDIAILRKPVTVSGISRYQTMMTMNYLGSGAVPWNQQIYSTPDILSNPWDGDYNVLTEPGGNIPGIFGGLCSAHDPNMFMLAGRDRGDNIILCRTTSDLLICNTPTITRPYVKGIESDFAHLVS